MGNIESDLRDAEKKAQKVTAEINSNKESIKAAETNIKQLKSNIRDEEKLLETKLKEIEQVGGLFEKLKEKDRLDSEAVIAAQEAYQKISSGLLQCDDGSNATLEQQLINAKQKLSQAQTEIKQCEMTLSHNKQQLSKKKVDMKSTENDSQKDNKKLEDLQKDLKNFENELNKMNYQEGQMESLNEQKHALIEEIKRLSNIVDNFESRYPQLRFHYRDPEPNFNRNSVKGPVCNSIRVNDMQAAYALEVAAGARVNILSLLYIFLIKTLT